MRADSSRVGPETDEGAQLVVLAAGASRRFGGRPKALLEVDGEPAVVRILRVAVAAGIENLLVVTGRHHEVLAPVVHGAAARVVHNEAWERGRTGSLQAGLREVPASRDVVLWPVDHPFVEANTVRGLGRVAAADPIATWVIPTYDGKGGHPVWLKPPAWRLIQDMAPDAPLRALLPRLGAQVRRVPTDDPWVVVGTDTPEEYALARALRSLRG